MIREQQQQQQQLKLLPQFMKDYYKKHNVNGLDEYISGKNKRNPPPRFVRINPQFVVDDENENENETVVSQQLQDEIDLHCKKQNKTASSYICRRVKWMDELSSSNNTNIKKNLAFYSVPGDFVLSQSPLYKQGKIYGMDVSSGAAVAALELESISRTTDKQNNEFAAADVSVLDICCCPGLKLIAIADCLSSSCSSSTNVHVVGVDISENRMNVCKSLLRKYMTFEDHDSFTSSNTTTSVSTTRQRQLSPTTTTTTGVVRLQLFNDDGTTFRYTNAMKANKLVFDSFAESQEELILEEIIDGRVRKKKRRKNNRSARGRETKRLKRITTDWIESSSAAAMNKNEEIKEMVYDRVLVDAECTTDGSVKHLREQLNKTITKIMVSKEDDNNNNGGQSASEYNNSSFKILEEESIVELQKQLIESGFCQLKNDGILVYSTCSLSEAQNEEVVEYLLSKYPQTARLKTLQGVVTDQRIVMEGGLKGTLRFSPNLGDENLQAGGGFFLAKIIKTTKP